MANERTQALCAEMRESSDYTLGIVSGLTDEQWAKPTVNTGWSAKDTMVHLATIPLRNVDMWQHAMEGKPWTGEKSVDEFSAKKVKEWASWTGQQVVDEYKKNVAAAIAFLEKIGDKGLDQEWDHPAASIGRATIEGMANAGPRHHRKHADEIKAAANS